MFAYLVVSGFLNLSTWILLLLPNFLAARGWSSQQIGWAVGAYFLSYLVFQILAGRIADRIGNIPTAMIGTLVGAMGGILYFAALWFLPLIFAARLLHAMGYAMITAGALLQLLHSVPPHLRGRVMGYFGLPGFFMIGFGPLLAEWMVYRWGFEVVFLSVPAMYGAIALLLIRLPRTLAADAPHPWPFFTALKASFSPLKLVLFFSVLFGLCFSAWNSFLAPTVRSVGAGGVSGFGLGYGLGAVMTRLGISHRLDTGGRRYVAVSSLFLYGLCLMFIPRSGSIYHLLLLGWICGMSHGIFYPSLSSIAAENFHPSITGQAMSLYLSASSLGMFVGPPLWGTIIDKVGNAPMFATAGVTMALGTLLFVLCRFCAPFWWRGLGKRWE